MLRGPNISPKSTKAACDEVECAEFELKSLHAGQQKAIERQFFWE